MEKHIGKTVKLAAALLCMCMMLVVGAFVATDTAYAGSDLTATAVVGAGGGAALRSSPSTDSSKVATLADGDTVKITLEVFTSASNPASDKRWYKVTSGGQSGYIRADLVSNIQYKMASAVTCNQVNYRKGAGTGMEKMGAFEKGEPVIVTLAAKAADSDKAWYRVMVDESTSYYLAGPNIRFDTEGDFYDYEETKDAQAAVQNQSSSQKSTANVDTSLSKTIAAKLKANPKNGGSANNVYTFDSNNCTKLFNITGYNGMNVPQGMEFTGTVYYIVFGKSNAQRIVTYSATGERLAATNFSFNMGKPNGIAYSPQTGLCYILKGKQNKAITWNPSTGKFGSVKTPYSSSGIGYDRKTDKLYASSLTGIRVYSGNGKFSHQKFFNRCSHSDCCYVQDCCSYNGIVIHGVTGSNSQKTNYVDFYRASNGKYLGSIKITLGEIEGVAVDNNGYLQLLIYTSGKQDYIAQTPLNINDLA